MHPVRVRAMSIPVNTMAFAFPTIISYPGINATAFLGMLVNTASTVSHELFLIQYRSLFINPFNLVLAEPNLVCGDDFISVSFEEGIVKDEGLDLDGRFIHFKETDSSSCFAEKRGSVFYLSIPPPIDKSCGSNMEVTIF